MLTEVKPQNTVEFYSLILSLGLEPSSHHLLKQMHRMQGKCHAEGEQPEGLAIWEHMDLVVCTLHTTEEAKGWDPISCLMGN